MAITLQLETTVAAGGKIEFSSPELQAGQVVKVTVVVEDTSVPSPEQALDWDTASADEIASFLRASRVERETDVEL